MMARTKERSIARGSMTPRANGSHKGPSIKVDGESAAVAEACKKVDLDSRVMMNAKTVPIDCIATANQPRKHFDGEAMDELTASVKDRGIRQPLEVRQILELDPRRAKGKLY